MSRFRPNLSHVVLLWYLLAATLACGDNDLNYRYGFDLSELEFNLYTADMGIHPDSSVLDDPNNPFRWDPLGPETKWVIEADGRTVPRVYVWATALVFEPTGENQFYTAEALADLFQQGRVRPEYQPFIKNMAQRAYQSVLDNFPNSVSYLSDGVTSFPLNILAYDGLIALGATPSGGWVVVITEDGSRALIQSSEGEVEP